MQGIAKGAVESMKAWIKAISCGYCNRECFPVTIQFLAFGLVRYPMATSASTKS